MKYTAYILLMIIIFAGTVGCGNKEKALQLKKIDSLQTTLDSIGKLLTSIDTASAAKNQARVTDDLTYIQQSFSDTMEKQAGIKLGNYMRHGQLYSKLENNYNNATQEVEALNTQLKNLKQDIENNLVENDKFKEYFSTERRDVNKLKNTAKMLDVAYVKALRKQNILDSTVQEILVEIKQNAIDSVEQK